MRRISLHRHARDLALDALFVLLIAHFLVTGHIVPPAVVDLLRSDPPIVAVSPTDAPHQGPDAVPSHNESPDDTPGT